MYGGGGEGVWIGGAGWGGYRVAGVVHGPLGWGGGYTRETAECPAVWCRSSAIPLPAMQHDVTQYTSCATAASAGGADVGRMTNNLKRPEPVALATAIEALAARFGNRLVTSQAVREQHGHTTTWLPNQPPDAGGVAQEKARTRTRRGRQRPQAKGTEGTLPVAVTDDGV